MGKEFFLPVFWAKGLGAILDQMLVWCLGTPQSSTAFSKVPLMISVILCICSIVEICCRNPNWWSGRIRFSSSIGPHLLSIAISKILLIIGNKLIGLYEPTSSSSSPGFGLIMVYATFPWAGKYPVLIMELHVDFYGHFFQYFPRNLVTSWGFPWAEIFLYYVLNFLRCKKCDWLYYL
jgi:hypothetical protein